MRYKINVTQPIKFYFAFFLSLGVGVLTIMTWSFYSEGKHIQHTVENQTQQAAQKELSEAITNTVLIIQKELTDISEWDEVHQQFHDPSYYFFWHDERLIESSYYRPYYNALELYKKDRKLLTGASPGKDIILHTTMPDGLEQLQQQILVELSPTQKAQLIIYHPIYQRDAPDILGYVGVALDLKTALLTMNQFFYLDKASIDFTGNKTISIDELLPQIQYQPISNPVNTYLWALIEQFIIEMIIALAVSSLVLLFIFNQLIRSPLLVLSKSLHQLKASPQVDHLPPIQPFLIKEYEELKHAIHDYHSQLHSAQLELDQQNLLVWEQARRDALTNVYNRRAFDEAWGEIITSFKNSELPTPTAFVLFDCDFFKALNDTYGHEVGDEVIRLSASRIQSSLPIECPPYRIGGDEFAVIIQHRDMEDIRKICQHTLNELSEISFVKLGVKEKLSFSVGISSIAQEKEDSISRLPRQADIAMYKAKQTVQTKIQSYNQRLEDESSVFVSNQTINTIVNSVLTGENIQMHFQPIVSISNSSCYFEALIRIKGEDGLIYPDKIFTLVERRRLEVELDYQVIQAILKAIESGQLPDKTGLSINISGKTLIQPELVDLFEPFVKWLETYKIVIEITETILIDHMDYAQNVLNKLREKGFLIALDDFGSGYSSIRYLAHMPVDIIKFDMTMTKALNSDEKTKQIIMTTAKMVRHAGFDLVMEGVETQEMFDQAKAAGATHLQGYLLGKPNADFVSPSTKYC